MNKKKTNKPQPPPRRLPSLLETADPRQLAILITDAGTLDTLDALSTFALLTMDQLGGFDPQQRTELQNRAELAHASIRRTLAEVEDEARKARAAA